MVPGMRPRRLSTNGHREIRESACADRTTPELGLRVMPEFEKPRGLTLRRSMTTSGIRANWKCRSPVYRGARSDNRIGLLLDQHDRFGPFLPAALRLEGYHRARAAGLIKDNFINCASVPLLRASALREVGNYLTREEQDGAQGCEDWDLSMRIAERYEVHLAPAYLVGYRQSHGMSLAVREMMDSWKVIQRRAWLRNKHAAPSFFRHAGAAFYFWLGARSYVSSHYGAMPPFDVAGGAFGSGLSSQSFNVSTLHKKCRPVGRRTAMAAAEPPQPRNHELHFRRCFRLFTRQRPRRRFPGLFFPSCVRNGRSRSSGEGAISPAVRNAAVTI